MLTTGAMALKLYRKLLSGGAHPRWNSLVAGWHLDEASIGTAGGGAVSRADVLGNYTLTDNNTVASSNRGPVGTVARLDRDSVQSLNGSTSFWENMGTDPWTVCGWFKLDGTGTYPQAIFGTDLSTQPSLQIPSATTLQIYWVYNSVTQDATIVIDSNKMENQWIFFAAWWDGTKQYIQIDNFGTPGEETPTGLYTTTTTPNSGLHIGQLSNVRWWDGWLGPIGFWKNRVLSASDRTELYNSGVALRYADLSSNLLTSLAHWWDMDEASGTRTDEAGSEDLTEEGGTIVGETSTNGALSGSAASFVRANNEYLSKTDETALRWGGVPFAVTAWVYPLVADATPQGVVLKDNNSGAGVEYHLQYLTSGTDKFRFRGGGSSTYVYSATAATNTWHFVIVGSDGAGNNFISVDGAALVTTAVTYNGTGGAAALEIGKPSFAAWPFGGLVDEVYLHKNVTVDSDWIADMYNSGAGRRYPN